MKLINRIRAFLVTNPNSQIGAISRALDLPSGSLYHYMENDIAQGRISVVREVGAHHTYSISKDIHDSLMVLDAIELLEALGYTVEQWKE